MPRSAIPTEKGGSGANIDTFTLPADPSVSFTPVLNTHRQRVIIGRENDSDTIDGTGFVARGCSPIIPGRGGTTGQTLMSIKKSLTSFFVVTDITVDLFTTAAFTTMVAPPTIQLYLQTVPTISGGTVQGPVRETANASFGASVRFDASADNTLSTTALASSVAYAQNNVLIEEHTPRFINSTTAGIGYEKADRIHLIETSPITFNTSSLDSLNLFLNYTSATQNPSTNFWSVTYRTYSV